MREREREKEAMGRRVENGILEWGEVEKQEQGVLEEISKLGYYDVDRDVVRQKEMKRDKG